MKTYKEYLEEKKSKEGTVPYKQPEKTNMWAMDNILPKAEIAKPVAAAPTTAKQPTFDMPAVLKGVDLTQDRMQKAINYAKEGNYPAAAYEERVHNEKNGYMGLGYENSHIFNYDDPYLGELDRQREAIENRDPFSYDYRQDDLYKSILSQKEKEADRAYKDGYAQLSRQFDGDIPVNMLNKLYATKGEIIDQADSYIPQLQQLAREMYNDEGNRMVTNYNITKQLADEDYARWKDDRDFIVSGFENKYARDKYDKEFDYNKETRDLGWLHNNEILDKQLAHTTSERVANQEWTSAESEKERTFQKEMQNLVNSVGIKDAITNVAVNLVKTKMYSWESAFAAASQLVEFYGK